ncbi:DUF4404 family protein [Exilibacterium tricleocarpae]|uniref:DUF4404 family protein n=1 Tax=Exilibacterium tricleocarpae TaxID=2591008 RepID=A0A545ST86_9GAMM|nr:DUF4404 family protein [Exilibacterium tricleocarpae]TQV68171.1 DUF4404 family protein [Exilibacterium tricleocarpae]
MRDQLNDLLTKLNREIDAHDQLDDEQREQLRALSNHIDALLYAEEQPGDSEHEPIQESIVMLEDKFPRVTALLREVQQVLINIGV